jgi:hypothetical protein
MTDQANIDAQIQQETLQNRSRSVIMRRVNDAMDATVS